MKRRKEWQARCTECVCIIFVLGSNEGGTALRETTVRTPSSASSIITSLVFQTRYSLVPRRRMGLPVSAMPTLVAILASGYVVLALHVIMYCAFKLLDFDDFKLSQGRLQIRGPVCCSFGIQPFFFGHDGMDTCMISLAFFPVSYVRLNFRRVCGP